MRRPNSWLPPYWALRGKATVALGLQLSAKLNQWTLLVGSLALSYSLGAARFSALPLDERQVGEVLLTAAQSLAGVALLARLSFGLGRAALLASLFVAQLALGGVLRAGLHNTDAASAELFWFSGLYVLLAVWQLAQALPVLRGELRNRTAVQARAEEPQVRKQAA